MKKFCLKFTPLILILIVILAAFAPVVHAQDLGITVRISPVPDGAFFGVDGMQYNHAVTAVWPAGSKHTLSVLSVIQYGAGNKTRYTFSGWQTSKMPLPGGNVVTITADPSMSDIQANFGLEYALSLNYFSCPDPASCASPGTIYAGGSAYQSNADIWASPGATVTLLAVPNSGYVFTAWEPGPWQAIQGSINNVTMNGPVTVYARFQVTRKITLNSVPDGLLLYADRAQVPAGTTLEWGWDSTHSVGAVSPQQDKSGVWWVFSSWSDGGASTHAYKMAQSNMPTSLTATFVRGTAVAFNTSPAGLKLSIDGRDNWPAYNFLWGIGETHKVQAPARQTDAQGRIWNFSSWSNGGAAAQDITIPASAVDLGMRFTATYSPVGHMVVTSSVAGLNVEVDGAACSTPCDVERPVGSTVRVSAPPTIPSGEGSRLDFGGWSGSGNANQDWSYTLGADPVTATANYRLMNRLVSAADPPDGASWSIQPVSPDGFYDAQANVSVAVAALPGYRFRSWSGDLSGNRPAGVVNMNTPRLVRAQFDRSPYIAPAGVTNAAGRTPQTGVAPGSVVSIFGASLALDTATGPASPLVQTLGGVTVRLGDMLLPLFFVSPTQINVQLPDETVAGTQVLTVSADGLSDVQARVDIVRDAPGLFQQMQNEQAFALVVHEDGSPVTADAPAKAGELLTVYGTGFGPTDRPRPAGFAIPASPAYNLVDSAEVLIADRPSIPATGFAVPGRIGVDAVQFRVPDDAPSGGNATFRVRINGQDSNTVLLPIQ
jgi:uncharacterized protein (TIGR03437 family)